MFNAGESIPRTSALAQSNAESASTLKRTMKDYLEGVGWIKQPREQRFSQGKTWSAKMEPPGGIFALHSFTDNLQKWSPQSF
ncbi:MAG: hypothetical protein DRI57_23635 [Deltaproteobacteria bacterium]|nr:MAG: hypothetical protein DRI57_23635 [Deltaproteobacteria bacterium]